MSPEAMRRVVEQELAHHAAAMAQAARPDAAMFDRFGEQLLRMFEDRASAQYEAARSLAMRLDLLDVE